MKFRSLAALIFALLAFTPATAEPLVKAHPALWHVKGPLGEAYLLGSIHLLPKNIDWHTPAIKTAMAKANVFVFEVSTDEKAQDRIRELVAEMGMLPPGQSLRQMLPLAVREDFDAAIKSAGLPLEAVDHEKPWLVSLQLLVAEGTARHYSADAGVDHAVMLAAAKAHKPSRFFETIEQQLRLLAGSDDKLQIEEFAADLKNYRKDEDDLAPMIAAWSEGKADKLAALTNAELADQPDAKKALLTDRNQRWALQIETMLREKRVFFITVGAGHLAGPEGVPALLRAAGYKVEGP
ncbi:MAG: TraB/GumN family protein [Proteobacteria bacterium]|nr:TraB/GumN family protein [Pseudomonadota bacterium]